MKDEEVGSSNKQSIERAAKNMRRELEAGTTLSHYRIVRKIGAGGMGEVDLAEDTRLDRQVAIKLLPADFAADEDRVRRFAQEARATSALNHPNILTVYDIGTHHELDGESGASGNWRLESVFPLRRG